MKSPGEQHFLLMGGLFKGSLCHRLNVNSFLALNFTEHLFSFPTWPALHHSNLLVEERRFSFLSDPIGDVVLNSQCVLWNRCAGCHRRGWHHSWLVIKYFPGTSKMHSKDSGKEEWWWENFLYATPGCMFLSPYIDFNFGENECIR